MASLRPQPSRVSTKNAFIPKLKSATAVCCIAREICFDLDLLDGDENAIVDFKYAASEKLTWWFDHHESAFLTPEDEAHFQDDNSGKKFLDVNAQVVH